MDHFSCQLYSCGNSVTIMAENKIFWPKNVLCDWKERTAREKTIRTAVVAGQPGCDVAQA